MVGDTAVALLKAGAETDKKDGDGLLALELAPDAQVSTHLLYSLRPSLALILRLFICSKQANGR